MNKSFALALEELREAAAALTAPDIEDSSRWLLA